MNIAHPHHRITRHARLPASNTPRMVNPPRACWLRVGGLCAWLCVGLGLLGCDRQASDSGSLVGVWGRRGISDGRLQKPRAMVIDREDHLYIVDMTARIQVFDTAGNFLRGWETPTHELGRPTGLCIGNDGKVLVADTHYYRVLVYSPVGELLRSIGEKGENPGQFGLVTGVAQDARGNYYVSEYGENDRIQKFSPDWRFLREWGGHGSAAGQFLRPQKMVFDEEQRLWVTDACNHRIQVFDTEGKLLSVWGVEGAAPGQLYYPYDIALTNEAVYVCEYGNHRVQKFTCEGKSLGCWGSEGRNEGQLFNPWGLVRDSRGRLYVLDTNNHRVQAVEFP